ncbi:AEC family transporter [Breoghania sp.]|uniref:AEC family transporter n=1 Tax=Breoghania sp. TaxID=2065378 RepID=UPI00261C2358|nr:AEC family transporter [Breoghania sp.]MDJ0932763.1 AEC family transporter [Breoghania sp.]
MSSYHIFSLILPVFLLIAFGYVAAVTGLLKEQVGDALGKFVFTIAIPLLMFRTLATAFLNGASPWALWGTYFSSVIIVWTMATLISRAVFGREARYGVIAGISGAFSNIILVGLPVISASVSEAGLVPLFVIVSVHLPFMTVLSTLLMERAAAADGTRKARPMLQTLMVVSRNLATNPMVIGLVSGAVWRTTGLPVPDLPADVISKIAATAIPVALFSLGMSLRRLRHSR